MAIFTGKIIEAYYSNPENTTIEIIYKDGDKAINHYLVVDPSHTDFKDLIKEYPLAKLADSTVQRNLNALRKLNDVVDARVSMKMKDHNPKESFNSVIAFILEYDPSTQAEDLFKLKLKMFEMDTIKDHTSNDDKKKIRQAKSPLEVLLAYNDIVQQKK